MCDYSILSTKTRNAKVGDKLVTTNFGHGTSGFAAADDCETAVCVMPGTELAFDATIDKRWSEPTTHTTAIFRQINKDQQRMHHDVVELPDGKQILLTFLTEGQHATVLQLPAAPKTKAEAAEQERAEYVG